MMTRCLRIHHPFSFAQRIVAMNEQASQTRLLPGVPQRQAGGGRTGGSRRRVLLTIGAALLGAVLLLEVPAVEAQVQEDPMSSERKAQKSFGTVPDWAAPSSAAESAAPRRSPSRLQQMQTKNPGGGLPGGGAIPLGGLEWLLLAGGGYGWWKLRREA